MKGKKGQKKELFEKKQRDLETQLKILQELLIEKKLKRLSNILIYIGQQYMQKKIDVGYHRLMSVFKDPGNMKISEARKIAKTIPVPASTIYQLIEDQLNEQGTLEVVFEKKEGDLEIQFKILQELLTENKLRRLSDIFLYMDRQIVHKTIGGGYYRLINAVKFPGEMKFNDIRKLAKAFQAPTDIIYKLIDDQIDEEERVNNAEIQPNE